MTRLSALPYFGGKSAHSSTKIGEWIVAQLPIGKRYVEPYAGMCGVLLQRPKVSVEAINDLDGRISAWWRAIRDHPDELEQRLWSTPATSEVEYYAASKRLKTDTGRTDVEIAADVAVCLTLGFTASLGRVQFTTRIDVTKQRVRPWMVPPLAARMREVVVYNRPALKIVDEWCRKANAEDIVIYMDPPYRVNHGYAEDSIDDDFDDIVDAVKNTRCRVAISGYPGDRWDELGWRCERKQVLSTYSLGANADVEPRTECLWMNYPPVGQMSLV